MLKSLNGAFIDFRDEIILITVAFAIPLTTLPSMIF